MSESEEAGQGHAASKTDPAPIAVLKTLAQLSGALAAAGYVALRAHFNMLGVSSMVPLDAHRYLMEVWQLAAWLIDSYVFPVAALVALSAAIVLVTPWARKRWPGLKLWKLDALTWRTRNLPLLLALATLVLFGNALGVRSSAFDVATRMNQQGLDGVAERSGLTMHLVVLVLGTMLILITTWPEAAKPLWPRQLMVVAAVLLWLQLPLLYGTLLQPRLYPIALATFEDEKRSPICGLLVYATEHDLALWRADAKGGETVSLSREAVTMIQIGATRDLLEDARTASANGSPVPSCAVMMQTAQETHQ